MKDFRLLHQGFMVSASCYHNIKTSNENWPLGFQSFKILTTLASPRSVRRRSATNSMYCFIRHELIPMRSTGKASVKNSCNTQQDINRNVMSHQVSSLLDSQSTIRENMREDTVNQCWFVAIRIHRHDVCFVTWWCGLTIIFPTLTDLLNADSFGNDVLHSVLRWLLHQVAVQQAGKVTVEALGDTLIHMSGWLMLKQGWST